MTWPGDSGSLVVDPAGGAALGLVCAGDSAVGGFTGEWLVQLTEFDMLEYRFPDTFAEDALRGWGRVRAVRPGIEDSGWIQDAIRAAAGRSVRELLGTETTPVEATRPVTAA